MRETYVSHHTGLHGSLCKAVRLISSILTGEALHSGHVVLACLGMYLGGTWLARHCEETCKSRVNDFVSSSSVKQAHESHSMCESGNVNIPVFLTIELEKSFS